MSYAKKWTAVLVALLLLFTYLATCFLRVSAAAPSVNVAVYDDSVSASYKVSWSTVILPQATTPEVLLNSLKSQGQITDYVTAQGQLTSITFSSETLAADEASSWSCYINGISGDIGASLSADDAVVFCYQKPGSRPPSFTPPVVSQPESSLPSSSAQSSADGQGSSSLPPNPQAQSSASASESVPSSSSPSSEESQSPSSEESGRTTSNTLFHWTPEMATSLDNAYKWISLNEKGEYYLIAAGIAGKTVDATSFTRMRQSILAQKGLYTSATKLSQDILSLIFSGLNPEDFEGYNLLQELYNFPDLTSQRLYAVSYALMVYDSNAYEVPVKANNTREKLVDSLLTYQNQDGGFALSPRQESEISTTATAVIALSNYLDRDDVKSSVRGALSFLQENQNDDGSFSISGEPNSQDLSTVIVALSSLGISAEDERFVKNGVNIVNSLLSFQLPDGGFALTKGELSSVSATEQAVIALTAAQRQMNPFILQSAMDYQASIRPSDQKKSKGGMIALIAVIGGIVIIAAAAVPITYKLRKRALAADEVLPDESEPPEL